MTISLLSWLCHTVFVRSFVVESVAFFPFITWCNKSYCVCLHYAWLLLLVSSSSSSSSSSSPLPPTTMLLEYYNFSFVRPSVRFFVDVFLACVGRLGADWVERKGMKKCLAGGRGGGSLKMIVFIVYLFAFMWWQRTTGQREHRRHGWVLHRHHRWRRERMDRQEMEHRHRSMEQRLRHRRRLVEEPWAACHLRPLRLLAHLNLALFRTKEEHRERKANTPRSVNHYWSPPLLFLIALEWNLKQCMITKKRRKEKAQSSSGSITAHTPCSSSPTYAPNNDLPSQVFSSSRSDPLVVPLEL